MKKNSWIGQLSYAIREVILVVMGILIAVGINNANENRKQKKELRNIYQIIEKDLKNDIEEIDGILEFYEKNKAYYDKAVRGELTKKDYDEKPRLAFIIMGFPEISFDKRGFNLLSASILENDLTQDSLPSKIIDFYSERFLEIKIDNDFRQMDFEDNYMFWKNNKAWWSEFTSEKSSARFVDYALNSQDYKNRVSTFVFLTYDVFNPELVEFKERGEELLENISLVLSE